MWKIVIKNTPISSKYDVLGILHYILNRIIQKHLIKKTLFYHSFM